MNTMKTSTVIPRLWRTALVLLLSLTWGALLCGTAFAADANPPERSTFQGYLVDAEGVALGLAAPKNYDVIFRIFDNQTGGNNQWAEQQTVTVDKGYFSVLLGEGSAVGSEPRPVLSALFASQNASDRFVEMTVKGIGTGGSDSTIAPRLRLLTSPYAFLAKQASRIVNSAGTPLLSANDSTVTVAGNVEATGNVKGDTLNVTGQSTVASLTASGDVEARANANIHNMLRAKELYVAENIGARSIFAGDGIGGRVVEGRDYVISPAYYGVGMDLSGNIRSASLTSPNLYLGDDTLSGIERFGSSLGSFGGVEFWDGAVMYGRYGGGLGVRPTQPDRPEALRVLWNEDQVDVHTKNGLMTRTKNDIFTIYNGSDKSRLLQIYRSPAGFGFNLVGSSTSGSFDKYVAYDGVQWHYWSDRRLKTNIVAAESVLDRVMAVQMRRYHWKGGDPDAAPMLGVIAQELQLVFPELVSKQTPPTPNPECPDGVMSVASGSFGTIAIKAIQELKQEKDAEIAELKKENASLKAKVEVASSQADQIKQLVQQMARLEKLVATGGKPDLDARQAEVAGLGNGQGAEAKP